MLILIGNLPRDVTLVELGQVLDHPQVERCKRDFAQRAIRSGRKLEGPLWTSRTSVGKPSSVRRGL